MRAIIWTAEMDKTLKDGLSAKTITQAELALSLNIHPNAVSRRASKFGLARASGGRFPTLWEDWEVELLTNLWGVLIARDIAKQLDGKTRNAVIGKAHRLNLGSPKYRDIKRNDQPVRQPKGRRKPAPQEGDMKSIIKKQRPPIRIPDAKPLTSAPPISIMELGPDTCRAIVGYGAKGLAVYCGDQTFSGKSFCEGHCAMYYDYHPKRRYRS